MIIKKLSEVALVQAGGTPFRGNKDFWGGNIPWIKISDLNNGFVSSFKETITEEGLKNSSAKLFSKGTILYSIFATIGKMGILKIDATTNQAIAGITANEDIVKSMYLFYCLKNYTYKLLEQSVGVAQNNINSTKLRGLEIPLPSLPQQKQIIQKLDKLTSLIKLRKQSIQKTEYLTKSIFIEMFGDPMLNEKGWEIEELGKHLKIKHGFAFKSEFFSEEGDYILLTPGHYLEKGGFKSREGKEKYYTGKFPKEYLVDRGELLVAMTEQAPGLLGSLIFVPESKKYLHNQRLGLLEYDKNILNDYFIFSVFSNHNFRTNIQQTSVGTKVKHTSPTKIQEIKIIFPPITLQNKFATIVQKNEENIKKQKESLVKLEELYSASMQKSFSF